MALSHSGNFTASGDRKRADHTLSHEQVQKEKGANEVNSTTETKQQSQCQKLVDLNNILRKKTCVMLFKD